MPQWVEEEDQWGCPPSTEDATPKNEFTAPSVLTCPGGLVKDGLAFDEWIDVKLVCLAHPMSFYNCVTLKDAAVKFGES